MAVRDDENNSEEYKREKERLNLADLSKEDIDDEVGEGGDIDLNDERVAGDEEGIETTLGDFLDESTREKMEEMKKMSISEGEQEKSEVKTAIVPEVSDEKEEKLKYLASTKVIDDLIRLYGDDKAEISKAGERLKKNGIEPLYYLRKSEGKVGEKFPQEILLIDKKKGLNMTNVLINYFADSGEPQGWSDWKTTLEKSGFNLNDLEQARKMRMDMLRQRKEKTVKDERYIWYEGVANDLYNATKYPPTIGKDANEEERSKVAKEVERLDEQKKKAIGRLKERIPDIEELLKERNHIFWASKVLVEGWKEGNAWPNPEMAYDYLRNELRIDRTGVDKAVKEIEKKEDWLNIPEIIWLAGNAIGKEWKDLVETVNSTTDMAVKEGMIMLLKSASRMANNVGLRQNRMDLWTDSQKLLSVLGITPK